MAKSVLLCCPLAYWINWDVRNWNFSLFDKLFKSHFCLNVCGCVRRRHVSPQCCVTSSFIIRIHKRSSHTCSISWKTAQIYKYFSTLNFDLPIYGFKKVFHKSTSYMSCRSKPLRERFKSRLNMFNYADHF